MHESEPIGGVTMFLTNPATPPSEAVLRAVGVSKRYRRSAWALRDIDVAIRRSAVVGLVGPNGAGKTTLMRLWLGYEQPTAGNVYVNGAAPNDPILERVAFIPQASALYRELSVGEHLAVVKHFRPGFDTSFAEARLSELGIRLKATVGTLSGGQTAQVGLAIALGLHADVLLLDEPVANLDPLARREFLDLLSAQLVTSGATAVLSSHLVADIERVCDHLLVLGSGRKLLYAPIAEVRRTHWLVREAAPTTPGRAMVTVDATRPPGSQPASLEDIVLHYLEQGR